jgi:predicted Zn finger-like uncharacterized protein
MRLPLSPQRRVIVIPKGPKDTSARLVPRRAFGTPVAALSLLESSAPNDHVSPRVVFATDSLDLNRYMIAFACPHCGASLRVDESQAGRTGSCPACSKVVRAPASGGSSPSESSAASVRPSGQQTVHPRAAAEDTAPSLPDSPELEPSPDYPFLASPKEPEELRGSPCHIRIVLPGGRSACDPGQSRRPSVNSLRGGRGRRPPPKRRRGSPALVGATTDAPTQDRAVGAVPGRRSSQLPAEPGWCR